jgi:hypothetical protein
MAPRHETQRSGQFPRRVHVVDIDQGRDELRAVRTYYEILGVAPTASAAELRTAYRRLLRQAHPDMGGSSAILDLVNEAYDALKDPAKRSQYDAALRRGAHTTGSGPTGHRPAPPPGRARTPSHDPEHHLANTEVPVGRIAGQRLASVCLVPGPVECLSGSLTRRWAVLRNPQCHGAGPTLRPRPNSAGVTDGCGGQRESRCRSLSWRSLVRLRGCRPPAH